MSEINRNSHTGLLPCPMCGGTAAANTVRYSAKHVAEQQWEQDTFHGVNCIACGLDNKGIVGHGSPAMAAKAWNKRKTVSSVGDEMRLELQSMPPELMALAKDQFGAHFIQFEIWVGKVIDTAFEAGKAQQDGPAEPEETPIKLRLAAALRSAELWKDLALAPYAKLDIVNAGNCTSIAVKFHDDRMRDYGLLNALCATLDGGKNG